MAQNIGYATLSVIPSAKGFGKALSKDVDGEMLAVGKSGGASLLSGMAMPLTKLAAGIGGAVAAYAGFQAIIGGGIARQMQIENATAKLAGLGHSTEAISGIMDNALKSVKGTAFGLGDAASVAAAMVASGIAPGEHLTGVLKTVADTATIAGTDFQSMGAIFGSVAARGKLQGDDLLQLTSRGVPVLQFLGKQLGKTSAEISDMVSKGQIDFETFNAAMSANIGGAALASGNTTAGAIANMKAAFSRLGATLTGGVFPLFKEFFNVVTGVTDAIQVRLEATLGPLGARIQAAISPPLQALKEQIPAVLDLLTSGDFNGKIRAALHVEEDSTLVNVVLGIREAILGMGQVIGDTLAPIGQGIRDVFSALGDSASTALPLLSPVGALLSILGAAMPSLGAALGSVLTAIAPSLPSLAASMASLVSAAAQLVTALATALTPVLSQLGSGLATVAPIVAQVATVIAGVLTTAALALAPIIQSLAVVISDVLAAVLPIVADLFTQLAPSITQAATVVGDLVAALAPLIGTLLDALIPVIQSLLPVVQTVFGFVTDVIKVAVDLVSGIISAFSAALRGDWDSFWKIIGDTLQKAWDGILAAVGKAIDGLIKWFSDLLPRIMETLSGIGEWLVDNGRKLVDGMFRGIQALWENVSAWFRDLPNVVGGFVSGAGDWLWNAGRDIINGLLDGIGSMMGAIGRAILNIVPEAIRGPFEAALGIHSPSRVFKGYGVNIGEGLALGIASMESQVSGATTGLADAATAAMDGTRLAMSADVTGAVGGGGIGGRLDALIGTAGSPSASLEYHQHGGQGLTAEQELRKAARKLKTLTDAR